MSAMRALVQRTHRSETRGIGLVHEKETGDGPDGVKFGFAIDEVLEIRGDFQVRDDAAQSFRSEIDHRDDVRRIDVGCKIGMLIL